MIEMQHTECGQVAFLYDHVPLSGEVLQSRFSFRPNGRPVKARAPLLCFGCGEHIRLDALKPVPLGSTELGRTFHRLKVPI